MFGCLKKFIFIIIVVLATIGFVSIGGLNLVDKYFHNPFGSAQSKIEKAAQIADFSKMDEEFELVSSSKLPKIGNYVYIKHNTTSQRFYFIKTTKTDVLTKEDFNNKKAEEKIKKFISDFKILQFENFSIKNNSSLQAMGQDIPYVNFESEISNLPLKGVEGTIGVADKNDKNIIIISLNANGKYSQIITKVLLQEIN